MILEPHFLSHWKTQALIGAVGAGPALTAILGLWGHCQTCKQWEFAFTPRMLAGICRFTGDPQLLLTELENCKFLDKTEGDVWEVHGWAEKNDILVRAWDNGKKFAEKRKAGTPRTGFGHPQNGKSAPPEQVLGTPETGSGVGDRIGEERRGEEENTPHPPKGGAESAISKLLHHLPSGFPEKRKALLLRWLGYKAEKGQSYKGATGITAWVNLMAPHSDTTVEAAVDMAIANNWAGCFPDRVLANQRFAGGKQPPPPAEKKEGPENWQAVALELWPGADLPPEFHQLPDDSQWQVRQAAKNSGGAA